MSEATSALQTEFESKFKDINSKVDTVEKSIKAVTASTTNLESSISKLENKLRRNWKPLIHIYWPFLTKTINFQQVGQQMSSARIFEVSFKYSSLGELGRNLRLTKIHPSFPPPDQNFPNSKSPTKTKLIQTKLPFSQPQTSSAALSTEIPTTSMQDESKPLLAFQRRFSTSFPSDSQWLGLQIHRKSKHIARLWSQNINGIKRNKALTQ